MILLTDIIPNYTAALQTEFAGQFVDYDDGKKSKEYEAALNAKGFGVLLMPLLIGKRMDKAGAMTVAKAMLLVRFGINPEKNPSGANISIEQAISRVISKVTGVRLGTPPKFAESDPDNLFSLNTNDPGLIEYDLGFYVPTYFQ